MPGICPNCVTLVQEGDSCPRCQGPLISTAQWSQEKDRFLAGRSSEGRTEPGAPGENMPLPDAPGNTGEQEKRVPRFAFRFFLGAVASVAMFLLILVFTCSGNGG